MKKQNILIVDDDATNISMLVEILDEDYNLFGATDGATALEIANSDENIDLILLDIMMPEMDGYEVAHQLRNNKKTSEVPFIFLTAKSDTQSIVKGFQKGAVDYISKPYSKEELLARVQTHLKLHSLNRELIENKNFLQSMLDSSSHAIIATDVDGIITLFNRAAANMLGYTSDELVGNETPVLFHDIDEIKQRADEFSKELNTKIEPGFDVFIAQSKKGLDSVQEWKYITKSKKTIIVNLVLSTLKDTNANITGYMGIAEDITKHKEMHGKLHEQEELMIAQSRQAAMGEMLSMIAHQWRQPLSIIAMAINNLKLDMELEAEIIPAQIYEMGEGILAQTMHLSQTINDFSDFFKPSKEKKIISVCPIMENVKGMLKKSLENKNIALEISTDCHNEILTFPNELLQVFLNLINNAKDALLEHKVTEAKIGISISEDEEFIVISICDNGGGISEVILAHLGEPYVSSKQQSGTGLGIYMSKIIVEKHLLGKISWENRDGGACFIIKLPLYVESVENGLLKISTTNEVHSL